MAESMLVALADAIAADLNGAQSVPESPFAFAFNAAVRFAEVRDLKTISKDDVPLVVLIPMRDSESRMGVGRQFRGEYDFDLVIYARVGVGDVAEEKCRRLMDLRQQIRDRYKAAKITVSGIKRADAALSEIVAEPAFGGWALLEQGCFVSSQTFAWTVMA